MMMFQIISLTIKKINYLYFWSGNKPLPKNIAFTGPEIIKKGKTSIFYTDKDKTILFKFVKTKKSESLFRVVGENIDKYLYISSAAKELKGNKLLNNLGISVPSPYGVGFPFYVFSPYRCVYAQEYFPETMPLNTFLDSTPSANERKYVLKAVFDDIQKMHRKQIYFNDMHPGDVLVDSQNNIHWVDTRAKKIIIKKKYNKLFQKQFAKFLRSLKHHGVKEEELPLDKFC